ncbi:thyroid receptor-interacting 11, putative [Babesia ovata]|uniref:Thyroid receptor-interacting 11, putative n=1 Tax=Babesia ovata TaxID=189622 RepID=A0A2H6KFF8_9APIC|nr:thyroid receptor-interacting 11, putative [Babesia ovata]GBE61733.1 thyroid receptor-interacting 11, putative [Babesia ovata]
MAMSLLDAPPPGSEPTGVDVTPPCLAGYRVYKDLKSKKRYDRDFRRRKRNLAVIESRFGDVLRKESKRRPKSPKRLLDEVFNQLGCIRPQLVEYLRRTPEALVTRLQRFFDIPVYLKSDNNDAVVESAFPDLHSIEGAAPAPDTAAEEASCGGTTSVPWPVSDIGKEVLTSFLHTLSQKYEIISSLESQVAELSRENTDLSLKLSNAYSELFQLELDKSSSDQRYLDALTSLTESLYISATRCANLQRLVIKRGKQLSVQERSLFLAENALAHHCSLNNTPCPTFSKTGSQFEYDASSLENPGSTAPNIASFTLNDVDCATSAYDSDRQGSLDDEGINSAGSQAGGKASASSTSFYEFGSDLEYSRQEIPSPNEGELIIAEFDGEKAVSVCPLPDAPSTLPVQTASPEPGAVENDSHDAEADVMRELHLEKRSVDAVTSLPREVREQVSSPAFPPLLGSPALDSISVAGVVRSELANAVLPSPAIAPVSGDSVGQVVHDDAKVRELISDISVLQKKSQSYIRHIRALKRENERLKSRARLPDDLRAELSTGSAGPLDYRMSGDLTSIGSGYYVPSSLGPSRVSPEEDTKVKELKAEISILQKQIQRSQEANEDRQRLQDQLAAEERRNRELYSELSVARRKLVTYHHELEQLVRSYGSGAQVAPDANQSSTVVSQDYDRSSKLGSTLSELKSVLLTLNSRVHSYESDNDVLRSELEHLRTKLSAVHDEVDHLRNQNQALAADTREAGCLAFDRLLHCLTDALGNMTRTSLEELETAPSEHGTTTSSQLGSDDLTAERITILEFENKLYTDKLSSLLDIVHQSSLERFQMHTTIARLNSDLHSSHQQLLKFSNQSSVLLQTSNDLDALRAKCTTYDDQVNRLKQMNTDLSDLNNRLGDDLHTLEEKSVSANNEVSALREEVRQLQSLLVGDTQAAHDSIRDRVSIIRLEGRCKFLDESLNNGRVELESLRSKNSDLVKSVMELRYALEQERASNAEYLKQVNAMSEAEGRLRNQLDRQETQIEGLRASVSSLTESLQQNAADMRAASERLLEKERTQSALSSTIDSLGSSLNSLLSSVRDAKPIALAPADMGPIDLSSIPNFNLTVYYGVLDTIQKSTMDNHEITDIAATAKDVSLARDKVCNILKCNYLLSALAAGLCRQMQEFSASMITAARSQDSSISPLVKCLGDSVNLELLRADFANRMSKAHAHAKELKSVIRQLYKNNPADVINRLKDHYEDALGKCQVKVEQLSSVIKSKEEDQLKLKQENSKLMSDCSSAAQALNEFDKRLEGQTQERSSLCAFALSMLPPAAQAECEQDNLRGILAAVRNVITKLTPYREKYKKLLENPPEPKVVTVTVPAPQQQPKAATVPVATDPAEQRAARPPAYVTDDGHGAGNYIQSSVNHGPGHHNPLRDHDVRRAIPNDAPLRLERALKDVDANVRYYVKNIKSTLRDYVRNLATQNDASETEYESPRTRSVGRSDVTVGNIGDFSDTESESSEVMLSDKPAPEDIVRNHARQFESICDLLDQARDVQSQVMERPPRLVYVDTPKQAPICPPSGSASDMAVMHHFHHLCAALKEYVAGRPMALSIDDVFYQMELVMLDQGDRDRRRAKWDHCVGNMVSVVIDVLRSISIDRKESVEGLRRRCSVASAALEEAQALCRLREEELHRRTTELSEACSRLEAMERHCRNVELELQKLSSEVPRVNERDLRALESSLAHREDDVRRLSKEVSKLHSVVFDLEEVNELLSQQLSRAKSDSERLGATVDKQQREISSLNSELALLEYV